MLNGRIGIHGTLKGLQDETNSNIRQRVAPPSSMVGTRDYNDLLNKPSIEEVELKGNKTFEQLGLEPLDNSDLMGLLTL